MPGQNRFFVVVALAPHSLIAFRYRVLQVVKKSPQCPLGGLAAVPSRSATEKATPGLQYSAEEVAFCEN